MLAATALTLASGTSLATQYAVQPTLGSIAADFGVSAFVTGQIITAVMAGYLIVLVLLVPLADRFARSISSYSTGWTCRHASCRSQRSNCRSTGRRIRTCRSHFHSRCRSRLRRRAFTPLEVRGSRVGIVLAGNSAGILLSHFVEGALESLLGWRSILVYFATLLVATGVLCVIVLPRHQE